MAALVFRLASMAAASLASLTGTWTHGSPERGGGVVRVKDSENGVQFQLECWRGAPSYNMGFLEGALEVEDGRATFVGERYSGRCELTFEFHADKVVIDYVEDRLHCGFGHAVYANGTYIRTSREEPDFIERP